MNRRQLLKILSTLPMALTPLQSVMAAKAAASGRRVILVELAGANDGLNTLVPIGNDHYYRLRPTIALQKADVLTLNDELSMHSSLQPLMKLWESGELAWVQGLGYPQPNRSHFNSIALWESGGDGTKAGRAGWMTHDIQHRLGRQVSDAHGISLKGGLNLFDSDGGKWMSLESTTQIETTSVALPAGGEQYNTALDLVAGKMHELHHTMDSLSAKLQKVPAAKRIPGGDIGKQLAQVLRLIRAGVDTPVFRVQLGGFDTHDYQLGRHAQLLSNLSNALYGFSHALANDGEWNNTLIMTYSEFGRRAAENASGGTDHGTAAPHIIAGGQVSGGIYGEAPNLGNLVDDDPAFTMDYRSVYESVLGDWFGIEDNKFSDYKSPKLQGLLI